jgi:16S rRNA (uracil1498-N3)-methyltransferase
MHKENHSFFFISDVSPTTAILTKEEYRHACSALRIRSDAAVYGTDGLGNIYKCKLTEKSRQTGEVEIVETAAHKPLSPAVHVYIGLPDREGFEDALIGLTALGAARIVPLTCRYCQETWWEPWENRLERLQRKMIAAVKQSHNPWLPALHKPQPFLPAIQMACSQAGDRAAIPIAADADGAPLETAFTGAKQVDRVDCFIGPPGGFSPDELEYFSLKNIPLVKIAHYRLRTELAAIVSCAGIMQHFISMTDRAAQSVLPEVK